MRLLLLVLGVMLLWASSSEAACTGSGLTWTCPAGATSSDVQAVINAASDGATVTFAAGSYAWGNTYINLSTTNGITLDGGNRGAIVTVGSPGNVLALTGVTGDTSKLYRVTGFVFQNAPANIPFQIAPGTGSIIRRWRFDHNTLSNFDPNSVSLLGQNGPFPTVYGLIDNNLFTGSVNFMPFKVLGTGAPLAQASSVRGTGNNMFFEDNRFNFASETGATVGAGCVDAWNYAGLVFRFNTVLNCKVRVHDTLHAGGASNFEVYNNRLEANANSVTSDGYRLIHNQGSGENFYFGNAFYSATSLRAQAMEIGHYRSASCEGGSLYACSSSQPQCDGTNPNTSKYKDGHFSTTATYEGYVCWYQPGRMANGGANAYGSLSPVYTWMNVDANTGNKVSPAVVDFDTSRYWSTNHFLANRDFYNAVSKLAQTSSTSPFNGTVGMGFGPLALRPSTCTHTTAPDGDDGGGVGYWATDQGTWNTSSSNPYGVQQNGVAGVLYRCSATSTWTVHYTPYTYPHPLRASQASDSTSPAPPTNVVVR